MAQRVNLSPTGLPVRKKAFIAKTEAAVSPIKKVRRFISNVNRMGLR